MYIFHGTVMAQVSDDKVGVFLAGYRNSTTRYLKIQQVKPALLIKLFSKFGLDKKPDIIEDPDDGSVSVHEGDDQDPFPDLVVGRTYEIPFEGKIKTTKDFIGRATTSSPSVDKLERPPGIKNADIQKALFCCTAVYRKNEDVISYFENDLKMHDFNEVSFSKGGQLRYLIAKSQRDVFISFKGTTTFLDILSDLNAFPLQSDFEGKCHSGFMKLASYIPSYAILKQYKDHRIILCGHSMGGAVAQLIALTMLVQMKSSSEQATSVQCITFGAPLVVTPGVGMFIEKHGLSKYMLNIINQNDPVPGILRMAETLEALGNAVDDSVNTWAKYVYPVLDVLSSIPLASVSSGAKIAKEVIQGVNKASTGLNEFLKAKRNSLKHMNNIYMPIGWFLFLNPTSCQSNLPEGFFAKHTERLKQAVGYYESDWVLQFEDNTEDINKALSLQDLMKDELLTQHTIDSYGLAFLSAAGKKPYEEEITEHFDDYVSSQRRMVKEINDFELQIHNTSIFLTVDENKKSMQMCLKGENLAFVILEESTFRGIPFLNQSGKMTEEDRTQDRLIINTDLDPIKLFSDNLIFTIKTHFGEKDEIYPKNQLQEIKGQTMSEAEVDGLRPLMLMKAFQRGVAVAKLQSTNEKKIGMLHNNSLLKILYALEEYACPKKKKVPTATLR